MSKIEELKENSLPIFKKLEADVEKANSLLQKAFTELLNINKENFPSKTMESMQEKLSLLNGILKLTEYNMMKILNIDNSQQIIFHCFGYQYDDLNNHVVTFFFQKSDMFLAIDDVRYQISTKCFSPTLFNKSECLLCRFETIKKDMYIQLPKVEQEILLQLEKEDFNATDSKLSEDMIVTKPVILFESVATVKFFKSEMKYKRPISISIKNFDVFCHVESMEYQLNKNDMVFSMKENHFQINDKYAICPDAKIFVWLDAENTNRLNKILNDLFSYNQLDTKFIQTDSSRRDITRKIINSFLDALSCVKLVNGRRIDSTIISNISLELMKTIPDDVFNDNWIIILLKIVYVAVNVIILFIPQQPTHKLVTILIQLIESRFFLDLINTR